MVLIVLLVPVLVGAFLLIMERVEVWPLGVAPLRGLDDLPITSRR